MPSFLKLRALSTRGASAAVKVVGSVPDTVAQFIQQIIGSIAGIFQNIA